MPNNILTFAQAIRDPQAFLNNVMQNSEIMKNPIAQNTIKMYQEKNVEGLKGIANNLCETNGTTLNAFLSQMGINQ